MHAETNDATPAIPDMTSAAVELPRHNASLSVAELNQMTFAEILSALGIIAKHRQSKDLDTTLTHCALDVIVLRGRSSERKAA